MLLETFNYHFENAILCAVSLDMTFSVVNGQQVAG